MGALFGERVSNDLRGYWEVKTGVLPNDKRVDAFFEGRNPQIVDTLSFRIASAESGVLSILNSKLFGLFFPVWCFVFGFSVQCLVIVKKIDDTNNRATFTLWHHGSLVKIE
jgi:hypothetical protein